MFASKLKVKLVGKNKEGFKIYELKQPLVYKTKDDNFLVPTGFMTDLTSVPYPLDKFIKRDNKKYAKSAVLHDWAYTVGYPKLWSDKLFYNAMKSDETPLRYRLPFFLAVVIFGWFRYNRASK